MRSDAKASTAGSNQRKAGSRRKPALIGVSLAACLAALALVVGSASGATTRFLVEVFGSSAEPSFSADRGIVVDQATNEVYVLDSTEDSLYRFNANGTASDFGGLGSNVIDGEGTGDETPQGGLSIPGSRKESQIAIDESGGATDGNIYVAGGSAHRIDIFDAEGEFIGQLSEYSGGGLGETCGVAVDGAGKVYVGDYNNGVHVYEPAANPPVNGDNTATYTTAANPCTLAAGAGATAGFLFVDRYNGELLKLDAATGESKYAIATGASTVSVDPTTGHVFSARETGSSSSVDEYDASGASEASLVSSFKPGSTAEGVAVNGAAEEVYVARSSTSNVEVYGGATVVPDVTTEAPSSNTGTRATLAGTVNPDGVELDECFFEWGEGFGTGTPYTETTPCAETPAEIGAGTSPVAVHADISGLTPQGEEYHYRLVAVNPNGTVNGSNQNFTSPNTVFAEAASGITPTEATLNGSVNPDTATISECVFEWGEKPELNEPPQQFPEVAPCVPGPGGITGESPVAVSAILSGLHPGTTYAYRLRAVYPTGPITGPLVKGGQSVQTAGPAIVGAWTEGVTRTEALLKAQINPEGSATTYRFEYGKTEAYGSETPELAVGSDSEAHEVTRSLVGLEHGTTYHYRVIATNGVAENIGSDQAFTTYRIYVAETDCPNQSFRIGPSGALPDCRAHEMVSPVDKNGADIAVLPDASFDKLRWVQTSLSGEKLTYTSYRAFGDAPSARISNQYLASRGSSGWSSHGISAPLGESIAGGLLGGNSQVLEIEAFSPDLTSTWVKDENTIPLTPDGIEGEFNNYRRDNTSDTYHFIAGGGKNNTFTQGFAVKGLSKDQSHVVLTFVGSPARTYVSAEGALHLLSVFNDGTPQLGQAGAPNPVSSAVPDTRTHNLDHVISDDGSRIFWTDQSGGLFVRENPTEEQSAMSGTDCVEPDKACTVPISESVTTNDAYFLTATADGSRVLFSFDPNEGSLRQDLYEFDVETQSATLVARNTDGVPRTTDDFSHIYFESTDALAPGALGGQHNLYLKRGGNVTLVAVLAGIDVASGSIGNEGAGEGTVLGVPAVSGYGVLAFPPYLRASRLAPDGRHFAFQSVRSLTGYDNSDARNGEPDVEVFVYDSESDQLRCASCNPSGGRPAGGMLQRPFQTGGLLVQNGSGTDGARRWTAAWLPTWEQSLHASNVLSSDGERVFFNSFDALVSQDTNGVQDVYQWEAVGNGSCTESSPSFSEVNDGCVSLISSGESPEKSEFLDASPDGNDVFFETNLSLLPQDPGLIDIYDARVDGGYPQPPEAPECVGDACQSVPEPPNDRTPASAGFRGAGDPAPTRNCSTAARRAAKLSRRAKALRRKAKRSQSAVRSKALAERSRRYARRARALSKSATRCRRANRRASR